MKLIYSLLLLAAVGVGQPLWAQPNLKEVKSLLKKAEKPLIYENYREALPFLAQARELAPNDTTVLRLLAFTYFRIGQKWKALQIYKQIVPGYAKPSDELNYYYARTLHATGNINQAIEYYKKVSFRFEPNTRFGDPAIGVALVQCRNAIDLLAKPVEVKIEPLGPAVNSEYPDFAPVITADESQLFFTSRRPTNIGNKLHDGFKYEDIYYSNNIGNNWSPAVNLGPPINTEYHDASIALSADGQTLFMYSDENGGDIFTCKLKGDKWDKPVNMGKKINTKYWEPSVCISADGNYLFYVSNKPGHVGTFPNRDIYVSRRGDDGQWLEGENLGPTINTPLDEESPFFHPDGKTLYFSSQGHNSMGGFDIFKSEKQSWGGGWSKPENLGYPVNTPDDDVYFVISASGEHGYYASERDSSSGGLGGKDIYRITFPRPGKPVAIEPKPGETTRPEIKPIPRIAVTLLKGVITDSSTGKVIEAKIKVIDLEKNKQVSDFNSNQATGKYLLALQGGKNYGIYVQADGFLDYTENINIPDTADYQEIVKNIALQSRRKGSKVILKNIFFDFDKATLRPESEYELQRLLKILNEFPTMRVRIGGHTDNRGSDEYNQKLSENRAKAVVDYLIKHGINAARLEAKGYGEMQPIATNDTDAGRQENRRTELEILED